MAPASPGEHLITVTDPQLPTDVRTRFIMAAVERAIGDAGLTSGPESLPSDPEVLSVSAYRETLAARLHAPGG